MSALTVDQERALIAAAQAGDLDARNTLVLQWRWWVRKVAGHFARINRRHEHDDLEQAGIVGLMKGIEEFDLTRGVRLMTYAHYHVTNPMRLMLRQKEEVRGWHKGDEWFDRRPAPDNVASDLIRRELLEETASRMRYLPPREQEIVERYYLGELTYREIGEGLGISHERVRVLLNRAIERLGRPASAQL